MAATLGVPEPLSATGLRCRAVVPGAVGTPAPPDDS